MGANKKMELETIRQSAFLFLAGGGLTAIGCRSILAGYRERQAINRADYNKLLSDYDQRISKLPENDRRSILESYHIDQILKREPTKKNLPLIEENLRQELEKRKAMGWRVIPLDDILTLPLTGIRPR